MNQRGIVERVQDLCSFVIRFNKKATCPQETWDYWEATVFTSKRWMHFVSDGNAKAVSRYLRRDENLIKHLKEERYTGGKTKIICLGGKFRHILNSSEKVFYGGNTKFTYTVCQWIEVEAVEIGKHIHHKMCGHGGERMGKVWALNDKGKKNTCFFLS